MLTGAEFPVGERVFQLLQHLGISKAHFAARFPNDWNDLAANHPDVIATLTLIGPRGIATEVSGTFSTRLLVITGDKGSQAQSVRQALANLPEAKSLVLPDYTNLSWSDTTEEHGEEVLAAMTDFLTHCGTVGMMQKYQSCSRRREKSLKFLTASKVLDRRWYYYLWPCPSPNGSPSWPSLVSDIAPLSLGEPIWVQCTSWKLERAEDMAPYVADAGSTY